MKRYSKIKKVNNNQSKKTADGFTQTTNDNDRIVIDDVVTQCIIPDNAKNNRNDIKHAKLDNDSDSVLSISDSCCSIDSNKTVPGCNDDIISKKVSTFIKKVLHNELPKDHQSPLVSMILSRRSARLSQLHLEDEILMKTAELLTINSRYEKQYNDVQQLEDVQQTWRKKFQTLNLYMESIQHQIESLPILPNPVVKHVRNVGTQMSLSD